MSLQLGRVKEEPKWEESEVKELYAQHDVTQDMVVGPEQLQPPNIASAFTAPNIKIEVECDQQEEIVPPRKKRKNTHFTENEKLMIINVFKYVGETWPADKYRSKQDMKDKTAKIVGISKSAVYRILKEYNKTDTVKPAATTKRLTIVEKLDDFDKSRIRKIVHSFYLKGELPTAKKVLHIVNTDILLPNLGLTSLKKILKHLKFKYVKRRGNNGLIDRDDIALWRINYLEKIKSCRQQGRPVYYLAETWANAANAAGKACKDVQSHKQAFTEVLSTSKTSAPKGPQLIVLHIGGETGFVPETELVIESKGTADHESIIAKFEHLFRTMLPKLEQHAVVVVNPSFLSRREKIPVRMWTKLAIQQWLASKGVHFDDEEKKVKLLDKVKAVKSQYQSYIIDEMAKEFGVEVLRLPPYHCQLNPIELMWADVKSYVERKKTTFKMSDVKKRIQESLNYAENWQKCISQVKIEEEKYERLDDEIDKTIDFCVINELGETSESSSDTEAESDSN